MLKIKLMNRFLIPFCCFLFHAVSMLVSCKNSNKEVNQLTEKEKHDGWALLFDGKSTNGWHLYNEGNAASAWIVKDDELYCAPDGKLKHGDLTSDKEFENFDLRFEWELIKEGNSGVFISVIERKDIPTAWASGPEYQLLDNSHPDYKIPSKRAGCLYGFAPQRDSVDTKPVGEWNQFRIKQEKGRIEFYLNGTLTAQENLASQAWADTASKSGFKRFPEFGKYAKGRIALQDWSKGVSFRNIKVKEL